MPAEEFTVPCDAEWYASPSHTILRVIRTNFSQITVGWILPMSQRTDVVRNIYTVRSFLQALVRQNLKALFPLGSLKITSKKLHIFQTRIYKNFSSNIYRLWHCYLRTSQSLLRSTPTLRLARRFMDDTYANLQQSGTQAVLCSRALGDIRSAQIPDSTFRVARIHRCHISLDLLNLSGYTT